MKKICLTIAGSDSSGGAGIQADIKSMEANGVFAMSVITGITAQNSHSIASVQVLDKSLVASQIDCLFADYKIAGVKIGALFNTDLITLVANKIQQYQLSKVVLDPVMISKSKVPLLDQKSIATFIKAFANKNLLLTPNIDEVEQILGINIKNESDLKSAIAKFQELGFQNVLIKGGHFWGDAITDYFSLASDKMIYKIRHPRIKTKNTHGTGCSLAAAIVALWAKTNNLKKAIKLAIKYVYLGIQNGLNYGEGFGPINHFWKEKNDFKTK